MEYFAGRERTTAFRIFLRDRDGNELFEVPINTEDDKADQMDLGTAVSFMKDPGSLGFVVFSKEERDREGRLLNQEVESSGAS